MTITEKITDSIKGVFGQNFNVYYHDEPTLNLITSGMAFPCAIVQLITTGTVVFQGGQVKERVTAAVFFVEPSSFDFDAMENEEIIDRCKRRAFRWAASLNLDYELTLNTIERTSRVYDQYDDIVTGFGVLADITEVNGWSFCEEKVMRSDFNNDFSHDFGGGLYPILPPRPIIN